MTRFTVTSDRRPAPALETFDRMAAPKSCFWSFGRLRISAVRTRPAALPEHDVHSLALQIDSSVATRNVKSREMALQGAAQLLLVTGPGAFFCGRSATAALSGKSRAS
jgi:hypothetical protein